MRENSPSCDHPIISYNFSVLAKCPTFDLTLLEYIYIHKLSPILNNHNSSNPLNIFWISKDFCLFAWFSPDMAWTDAFLFNLLPGYKRCSSRDKADLHHHYRFSIYARCSLCFPDSISVPFHLPRIRSVLPNIYWKNW